MLADAAPDDGLGHLSRSSGLAQALEDEGIEAICLGLGAPGGLERGSIGWTPADLASLDPPPGSGVVVLDSYRAEAAEVREWAPGRALVGFWDMGEPPPADLVISVALESPGVTGLFGPRYACLGREYWDPSPPLIADRVRRILVAVGGTDPAGAAEDLYRAAQAAAPDAEVLIVVGPSGSEPSGAIVLRSPPSLRGPLLESDLVVTAAGQTMLEALASGIPCIALPVVPNQGPGAKLLGELGAVRVAEPGDLDGLREEIAGLVTDPKARDALSERGSECVDGRGALRIAAEISGILS